ncbi:response regulator, partial [bacterium]|nr:response regulator [bacterium]
MDKIEDKILVVDDDPEMLKALELTLKDAGYPVTTVNNGEKAISILNLDEFGLMITDMKMPGMSGLELIKKVSEKGMDIGIIMITGVTITMNPRSWVLSSTYEGYPVTMAGTPAIPSDSTTEGCRTLAR